MPQNASNERTVVLNAYHCFFNKPGSGRKSASSGFTLVEVLVALAVLGIALAAILSGMARYADTAVHLRDKTVALWVAHNRLTEIELEPVWPATGRSDGTMEMSGAEWEWQAEVKETPDPKVRRVEVSVQQKDHEGELIRLAAFLSSSGRQSQ